MLTRKGETRPMVDLTGKFFLLDELDEQFVRECVDVEAYREYEGRWVKNAYDPQFTVDGRYDEKAAQAAESLDIYICMRLKTAGKAFKIEKHVHNYPHCWRTDKPVLYYPLDSWFIRSTAAKERMIELNRTIRWKPRVDRHGPFRQVAREPQRLEPLAFTLLGHAAAHLGHRGPLRDEVHRFD